MKTLMQMGLRIALAQMPVVAGNPRTNATWMMNEIARAKTRGIDILIFPELCVPGYLIGDEAEDESFVRDVWYWNDRIVESTKGSDMVVIFGTYAIDREGALGAGPDLDMVIFAPEGGGGVGFDIPLMHHRRYKFTFDDDIRFSKALGQVAAAMLKMGRDIGRLVSFFAHFIGEQLVM